MPVGIVAVPPPPHHGMDGPKEPMARLLFADDKGVVYDHPTLRAAVRSADDLLAPRERPLSLPAGATLAMLPGRRPVGYDPATGAQVVLDEVRVGRRRIVPHAVAAAETCKYGTTARRISSAHSRPAAHNTSQRYGRHRAQLDAISPRGSNAAK